MELLVKIYLKLVMEKSFKELRKRMIIISIRLLGELEYLSPIIFRFSDFCNSILSCQNLSPSPLSLS